MQGLAHRLESFGSDTAGVVGFDAGDDGAPGADGVPAGGGQHNELGAAVAGVGSAFEEPVGFELVDELGHRGAGHPGPGGEIGQPGAFGLDVAEDMEVTQPQPDPGLVRDGLAGGEQLFAKDPEVMHEELADG